jgi:outer membrane protein TolC
METIQAKPTESRMPLYAGYLKKKIDVEMAKLDKDVVKGAMEQVQAKLEKEVDDSEAKMKAAQQELKTKQAKVRSFQDVFEVNEDAESVPKKKKAKKASS